MSTVTNTARSAGPPNRISLSLAAAKAGDVCRVCGKPGHKAGFVGSVYQDCINKPCYLCKMPGHTTATCPFRLNPGHQAKAQAGRAGDGGNNFMQGMLDRELTGAHRHAGLGINVKPPQYQVQSAILKLHARRVCCLEFHPTRDHLVMSGDKKGIIACWHMDKVNERTMFRDTHRYLVNALKFVPWIDEAACATASCDGTIKVLEIETGLHRELVDLNPGGYTTDKEWRMLYGVDACEALKVLVAGDSDGKLHLLDPRVKETVASLQLHRKGNKVVSISVNPAKPRIIMSAGNDHTARLFDIRALANSSTPGGESGPDNTALRISTNGASTSKQSASTSIPSAATSPGESSKPPADGASGKTGGGRGSGGGGRQSGGGRAGAHPAELMVLSHPRVVNAASFSPVTGRKVLTTCQDNRIRVWDNIWTAAGGAADRDIVHSHDFNRYLTPFKAEWDPKDLNEYRFIIGRYISEDFGGIALHPVDVLDAGTGALLRECVDSNLPTISPVNKPHPTRDLIVSGSSRSLYLWAPSEADEPAVMTRQPSGRPGTSTGLDLDALRRATYTFFGADPGSAEGKKKGKGGKGGKTKTMQDDSDDD